MAASMMYGAVLGVLLVVLDAVKSPVAWAAFWTAEAILLSTYARLTWKRTGLLWMTIQGAHGALIALLLIPASLAGYTLRNVPAVWIAANLVALVASYFLARTIHRDQFRRWRRHMDGMTLFDMLRFRHIPYLR